jgi:hypothetical protein
VGKIKVFVDLDDTLIDTARIKQDIFGKIALMGVPMAEIESNYRDARKEYGADYLKPFSESFQEFGIDREILYNGLQQMILQHMEEYLLEDRLLWLERFPSDRYEMYLLTYGNPDVQERKVQGLHLENLFEDRVIYASGDKVKEIQKLIAPGEKFVVIDDKREILDGIISEYPEQAEAWEATKSVDEQGQIKYNDPEGYYSPLDISREGKSY